MSFRSVKLFGILSLLFLIFSFLISFFETRIFGLTGLGSSFFSFSWELKLSTVFLGVTLLLISAQTLYCRGKGKLDTLLHTFAALSLLTLLLIPFSWQSRTLYLYPFSYVEIDGKVVGLKGLKVNRFGIEGKFFIKEREKVIEGEAAFNRPLISSEGFLWVKGITDLNGFPAVEVKFSEVSLVPFLFIVFFGAFTILLSVKLLKSGGRDVYEGRGEGAPETDR